MRGNSHVRFLGEGVAARSPPYPPHEEGSIPFARSTELPEISTISMYETNKWPFGRLLVEIQGGQELV